MPNRGTTSDRPMKYLGKGGKSSTRTKFIERGGKSTKSMIGTISKEQVRTPRFQPTASSVAK